MKHVVICGTFVAFAASAAMGQHLSMTHDGPAVQTPTNGTSFDRAGDLYFYEFNAESWDFLEDLSGNPGFNDIRVIDLAAALGYGSGSPVTLTGIAWQVTIETVGASWLSEARAYFDDNVAPDLSGLFLAPGAGNNAPGVGTFTQGTILKLADAGIPDIFLPDGKLRLEFYESYDDVVGAIDALWLNSTFVFQAIPTPGALALFGMGGLALARRRR